MENDLRQSFIETKNLFETKYLKFIDWEYDYEINNIFEEQNFNNVFEKNKSADEISLNENENQDSPTQNNLNFYLDELAERFYKCEPIFWMKKKFIKKYISKKKIRLINKDFDLDLT